jgi:hypothetical protein
MEASMALKGRMSRTILAANFLALDISLLLYLGFPPTAGTIHSRRPTHPDFPQPVESVTAGTLRSVYVADALVLPVVQQPSGKPNYVSKTAGEVTQFSSASNYGNIGLLAHNYLSGKSFSHLAVGQEIRLLYDDGRTEYFVVTEILRYQALEPKSPFSSFKNLNNADEILSVQEMFQRAYAGDRHVTFQTCISKFGNASWGRLFVVALPEPQLVGVAH